MAEVVSRTIASVGASMRGSLTSSSRMSPISWKTTAFMAAAPSHRACGLARVRRAQRNPDRAASMAARRDSRECY
jgi:hypothetical protein